MTAEFKSQKPKKVTIPELEALTRSKDYVPRNSGLKLGSTGKEVERLQGYLSAFGYMESICPRYLWIADRRSRSGSGSNRNLRRCHGPSATKISGIQSAARDRASG